jgi:TatD DNase family protein
MAKFFDSHAHLDDRAFNADREEVLTASLAELAGVLNPGADLSSSRMAVEMAGRYANFYAAVGFHPHDAKSLIPGDEDKLAGWAAEAKVVAIGEIGLDYYYDHSPREVQQAVFIRQLDLARQLKLPVIIHDREAHGDMLSIIQKEGRGLSGVFHCYSGDWELAEILLRLGFYLSFGGSLTFRTAEQTRVVAQKTPLERIILETDSPYLTPVPWRGQRNQPIRVRQAGEKLAALRRLSADVVADATTANVRALFNLPQ